ncbi:hypothetical protein CFOL_v3_11938 [Cephalotus follicularis]|uniref:DUF7894 domain-containing protein n=1 Tax=Cephalotus follicularis TaxID=3775 RepID=A0A1Q3BKD2_CEPFO|nr:hypothetical protein CFOL_v3_11938 [Cephalotus follicularis]
MKLGPKIVFLFNDPEGFGVAIAGALHPNPNSSLHRLEDLFELSLEGYGIKDCKACGNLVHFVDDNAISQVSLLLLNTYEPPILVCAIKEVLAQIVVEMSATTPKIIAPFVVASSKLKSGSKALASTGGKVSLYSVQIGAETDVTSTLATRTQKPPSPMQIHYEPLSCFHQLARVLKLPTSILIGQRSQSLSDEALEEDIETLNEIGELLASSTSLCFLREKVAWNPTKRSKNGEEPWRALYG